MKLRAFGEHRLIDWIRKNRCGEPSSSRDTGIGDDCAVIRSLSSEEILVTTDSLVEGVHFTRTRTPAESIGEKSVYVNLSDIAAMGGVPEFLFLNFGCSPELERSVALKTLSGIHKACKRYGVSLLGGDTFATADTMYITMTVIGKMKKGKAVLRRGAKPRDVLFLSGTIGASSIGLILVQGNKRLKHGETFLKGVDDRRSGAQARRAIRMFQTPLPHIDEGQFFARNGFASAMIDVSDGLSTDIHNLCRESGVGAAIYESRIPIDPCVVHFARTKRQALQLSLSGGEDYCLLAAVSPGKADAAAKRFEKIFGRPLYRIGEITPAGRGITIISEKGIARPLRKTGYEHFRQ